MTVCPAAPQVNIHQERYVVARTPRSLLLADLQTCRMSEVGWAEQGGEKFYFGNEKVRCSSLLPVP
jgi:intraflagellar transport protein 172